MACLRPQRSKRRHPSPCQSTPLQSPCWARRVLVVASVIVRSAAKKSSHPNPVGYFSDAPVVEAGKVNSHGWVHSFKAGTKGLNGTEIVHLTPHKGKLFGGTGFWMQTVFAPATVVRLDSPNGDWVVETVVYPYAGRAEILKVAKFTTNRWGKALNSPVEFLVAGFYVNYNGEGRCGLVVRNDANKQWSHKWYYTEKPFKSNYFSARAMESYKDSVTGIDYLFMNTGMPGIIKGYYDTSSSTRVTFDSRTESGAFPTRPLSIVTMGGRLYTAGGSFMRRRNDGQNPTWSKVFDMANHWSGTVDEAVGGLRGITAVPNPSGVGESLLFAWCPNGSSESCMTRLDPQGNGFKVTTEACVKALLGQIFGNNYKNPYSLANYNFALPVQSPVGLVHIVGFQALLFAFSVDEFPTDPRQEEIAGSGKKLAYYAGAGYLIRRSPTNYEVRVPGGPRPKVTQINPPFVSVRCHANSPWDDSVYMGGYDANFFEASNTAWVVKGTAAAAYLPEGWTPPTTTTTVTPSCYLCGLWSREERWLDLTETDLSRSVNPTSKRKAMDGEGETWGGARTFIIDLYVVHRVSTLRIHWRSCKCTEPGVRIMSSMDAETWETFLEPTLYTWGEHVPKTHEVDFRGRYLSIDATGAEDQYATFFEIEMFGYADVEEHVFMPDAIGGTNENGEYTCQAAQNYYNSEAYTSRCVTAQLLHVEACCAKEAPAESATTTTTTTATTATAHTATADGSMEMSTSNPTDFVEDAGVNTAIKKTIAGAGGVAEDDVNITSLDVVSQGRRLAGGSGTVRAEFSFPEAGLSALQAQNPSNMSTLLTTALEQEVGAGVFTVSVLSLTVAKRNVQPPNGDSNGQPRSGDGDDSGSSAGAWVAGILITLFVVGISAAAAWWWYRKGGNLSQVFPSSVVASEAPNNVVASEAPTLPCSDSKELHTE